jgi:hypothetical protein
MKLLLDSQDFRPRIPGPVAHWKMVCCGEVLKGPLGKEIETRASISHAAYYTTRNTLNPFGVPLWASLG